jgi:hypothetical protein
MSASFQAGFEDARERHGHAGLHLLMLAPITDRELSDYWQGWHYGNAVRASMRRKK